MPGAVVRLKKRGYRSGCGSSPKLFFRVGTGAVAVGKANKVAVAGMATVKVKVKPAKVIQRYRIFFFTVKVHFFHILRQNRLNE